MTYSWTEREVETLLHMRHFGHTMRAISAAVGRPEGAVSSQWRRLVREGKSGAPLPEDDADRAALKARYAPAALACQGHLRDLQAVGGRFVAMREVPRRVGNLPPERTETTQWHAARSQRRSSAPSS
jgi:hypothetical protein